MKSIVKQFLFYRHQHPRRLFSTNIATEAQTVWYQNRITIWDDEENRQKNSNNKKKNIHVLERKSQKRWLMDKLMD